LLNRGCAERRPSRILSGGACGGELRSYVFCEHPPICTSGVVRAWNTTFKHHFLFAIIISFSPPERRKSVKTRMATTLREPDAVRTSSERPEQERSCALLPRCLAYSRGRPAVRFPLGQREARVCWTGCVGRPVATGCDCTHARGTRVTQPPIVQSSYQTGDGRG
jgi:hypothetical protein